MTTPPPNPFFVLEWTVPLEYGQCLIQMPHQMSEIEIDEIEHLMELVIRQRHRSLERTVKPAAPESAAAARSPAC